MMQITYASEDQKEEWININAETFIPGLLMQKDEQKQVKNKTKEEELFLLSNDEQDHSIPKEKISLAEQILDDGAVKNNDMITQYLSNADLYFLLQVSKIISNAARGFMKKREKEQKEKEQKLKEYFLHDFNAFINHARIASLDYLEIEIPEQILNNFTSERNMSKAPTMCIERDVENVCCNANPPLKISIIGYEYGGLRCKQYRLKKNESLKFKFYFQQCQKIEESHHVTFLGQTFEFKDFTFTLFRPGGKTFKFKAESYTHNIFDRNYSYKQQNKFKSNPKDRVKMVEQAGLTFKFKFHISETDNYYPFDKPFYDFANFFPNFKNYFSSTKQKYDMLKNSNVLNPKSENHWFEKKKTYDPNFGQHPFYHSSNFGQQQSIDVLNPKSENYWFKKEQTHDLNFGQHPFYQNSDFGQQQSAFYQNSNFGQQEYPFYQNNNIGQQEYPFYQNNNFGQQQQFRFNHKQ